MKKFISPAILILTLALTYLALRLIFRSAPIPFPPNTTIVPAQGDYAYENKTNTFQTQFKASATDQNSIVFENNLGDISFYTPAVQSFGDIRSDSSPVADGSTLTYPAIFPGIDLKYTITSSRLLEEFIVKDATVAGQISRIEQRAQTKSTYVANEDGSITFYNKDKEVFTLPHPVMYETGNPGVKSEGIIYEIKPDGDQLIITKVITEDGKKWLADPKRLYPIAIDLVIDNGDTSGNWSSSDATNTTVSQETTIKQEGSGSVKVQTTAGGAPVTVDLMEFAFDHAAQAPAITNTITATGGTITYSGGYTIHTFTSSGTFTPSGSGNVEVLTVAGGGAGGNDRGGGGGGGGVIYNSSYAVTTTPVTVTVGAGGARSTDATGGTRGQNGGNSVFGSLTAIGGGNGGPENIKAGANGGSGGGTSYGSTTPGTGTSGQGNNGGVDGGGASRNTGGGGGAGGPGISGAATTIPPNGGPGIAYSISGSSVYYGGGGGGGSCLVDSTGAGQGAGGTGGGGAGGATNGQGVSGTTNTGGGGGGGGGVDQLAGNGGSGIVIVRYPTTGYTASGYVSNALGFTVSGGTITYSGGYTIHTFTSSGTFTPSGSGNVEVLTVAGGGGGGADRAGGGGGGGLVYESSIAVTAQTYTATVGNGGTGSTSDTTKGTVGSNSAFGSIIALGGGGGGSENTNSGSSGGSGGGGAYGGVGAAATQGNSGGTGITSPGRSPGGGGGAGAAGSNGTSTGTSGSVTGPAGGVGLQYSISGLSTYYAGGGGGGDNRDGVGNSGPGVGGLGGGGIGGLYTDANSAGNGIANTGGGGGGGGMFDTGRGGNGGSGIVIVRYLTPPYLQSYSEATTKTEGSYALKGVANITTSLNKTLTRTIASPLNLSDKPSVTFDIRASRTGSNIKVGLRDSGGTITEVTPNITQADTFQSVTIDLSGVANVNKDAIDQIIITIVNADAANTFYLDNMVATAPTSLNDTVTRSTAATDLSAVANITYWVRSSVAGSYATFGFGESAATEQTNTITIAQANTWEQKSWNIESISAASRNAVTKFAFTFTGDTSGASFYFDDIQTNALFAPTLGTATSLSDTSIRWNFTDNSTEETGFKIYDSTGATVLVTCASTNLTYCDETGLTPNTQYTRKISTYNASSNSITSGTVSGYTLAVVPPAPVVASRAATTVSVNPALGTNSAGTQMAIYREEGSTCDGTGGVYLAANGSSNGATAIWQTDATWGTVTATGLTSEKAYAFCVKARNGNSVETAFSPVGSHNAGFVPLSGNYICAQDTVNSSTFTNRYVDGGNAARYVIALDSGPGTTNNAVFEAKSCIMTLNSTDTLVVGSLELTGGSIAIATGGQIKIGQPVWAIDADADGYTSDTKLYVGAQPTNGVRKSAITTLATADCGDSTYATNNVCCTVATRYRDADADTYGNPSVSISACTTAGYVDNNTDCNDASASLYRSVAGYLDNDGDGYGAGAYTTCVGASGTYRASGADCYDGNASAYPGSGVCSASHRGDGSYDWNCSGGSSGCGTAFYNTYSPGTNYYRDPACGTDKFGDDRCCAHGPITFISSQVGCGGGGYSAGSYGLYQTIIDCGSGPVWGTSAASYGTQACQ